MKKVVAVILALSLVLCMASSAMALTLRPGDKGSAVTTLQKALNAAGYSEIKVDGAYGKETVAAVKLYQTMNGLKVDGIAGRKTLAKLLGTSSPNNNPKDDGVLRKGSTGAAVREMQQLLKDNGYPVGAVDGTFGSKTLKAVKAFQQLNGLKVDGAVGPQTLAVLKSAYVAPYIKAETYVKLKRGSSGAEVTRLQLALKALNFYKGNVTGYYNEATMDAVEAFQAAAGLKIDGIAGQMTQAALYAQ